MATIEVQPRQTPAEAGQPEVAVDVDDELAIHVDTIENWAAARQAWEMILREGHEFGRANNVEVEVMFVAGEQTSTLRFRLDQLDAATDAGDVLVLRFEEHEGIAKLARLTENGFDVELFHILTFT
jgi:hypothetical protein